LICACGLILAVNEPLVVDRAFASEGDVLSEEETNADELVQPESSATQEEEIDETDALELSEEILQLSIDDGQGNVSGLGEEDKIINEEEKALEEESNQEGVPEDSQVNQSPENETQEFIGASSEMGTACYSCCAAGKIIIKKMMVGGSGTFSFSGALSGSISASGGILSRSVSAGTHYVAEAAKEGWDLTGIVCSDKDSSGDVAAREATFKVGCGETVTCTFTNTKKGKIIVDKATDPCGSSQSFDFLVTGSGYQNFSLTDAAAPNEQQLVPGNYTISETMPTGWELTSAVCQGSVPGIPSSWMSVYNPGDTLNLAPGEIINCTFTNTKVEKGSIAGKKFGDINGDGIMGCGEYGLSGWTISLTGAATAATVTDNYGNYKFDDLMPGTYYVCEEARANWEQAAPTSGYACANGTKGYEIVLGAGQKITGKNFGNYKLGSISGKKFNDLDNDGNPREYGEPYLSGWTIRLYDAGANPWQLLAAQTTGADGAYSFAGLKMGSYKICEVMQGGWNQTFPAIADNNNSPSNGQEGQKCQTVNIAKSDTASSRNNFGNYKLPKVSVKACKLEDVDTDPATSTDRVPVSGWTVKLYNGTTLVSTKTTGADGCYTWNNLDPSAYYKVKEAVPSDWYAWTPTSVSCGAIALGQQCAVSFVNSKKVSVKICKYRDNDGDASTDNDREPVKNWPVQLSKNDNVIDTKYTGDNGCYTWNNLDPLAPPNYYDAREKMLQGWYPLGPTKVDCDPIVSGGKCKVNFVNAKYGKIKIIKEADPRDCQDFKFTGTGAIGTFYLDDDWGVCGCTDVNRPKYESFLLVPGQYSIAEEQPNQYWKLEEIVCNPAGAVTVLGNTATINLESGKEVVCTFKNKKYSPTRTQGFWKNHTQYTSGILANKFADGKMIIGDGVSHQDPIDTAGKLFGAYFANIAKTSSGAKRLPIDQARMQMAAQLVTAKLNCAAFGCQNSVKTLIGKADAAYAAGADRNLILSLAGELDGYNNSGDTIIIEGDPGNATPQASKSLADIAFWNLP